jgi:hypothetical protein
MEGSPGWLETALMDPIVSMPIEERLRRLSGADLADSKVPIIAEPVTLHSENLSHRHFEVLPQRNLGSIGPMAPAQASSPID